MTVWSSSSKAATSASEISKEIKSLIKEVSEERADATRLDELRRLYGRLITFGEFQLGGTTTTTMNPSHDDNSKSSNPVAAKWHAFLFKYHKIFVNQLCDRVQLGKKTAIRCLWGVIANSPLVSTNGMYRYVNPNLLQKWIYSMCQQENEEMDKTLRHMVEMEFLHPYRDVQYYTLIAMTQVANKHYDHIHNRNNNNNKGDNDDDQESSSSNVAEKLLQFLMMIPIPTSSRDLDDDRYMFPPPKDALPDEKVDEDFAHDDDDEESIEESEDDDSSLSSVEDTKQKIGPPPRKRQKRDEPKFAFQQIRAIRREYQQAWLAILKLPLSTTSLKRSLQFLPDKVLSNASQPLRFADFFMQAFNDHGSGILGVLALDGLFLLITQYDLEYKDFYKQLYRLITSRVLHAKYRTRFMSLLTNCLMRNEMLPAHLVAAFSKRLVRCALSAPPSGILAVLALVSNLLRKHPECSCLIHRSAGTEMEDTFVSTENDPEQSRALQSSLWELAVLERHYHPAVATLAKSIGRVEEAKAPLHDMQVFASHTYKSLFDQERKKRMKTSLTFKEPPSLFTKDDLFADILDCCPR